MYINAECRGILEHSAVVIRSPFWGNEKKFTSFHLTERWLTNPWWSCENSGPWRYGWPTNNTLLQNTQSGLLVLVPYMFIVDFYKQRVRCVTHWTVLLMSSCIINTIQSSRGKLSSSLSGLSLHLMSLCLCSLASQRQACNHFRLEMPWIVTLQLGLIRPYFKYLIK